MIDNIKLIAQSAIRIEFKDKIIYFDPFKLDDNYQNDADIIFITHPHYDHFSPTDLLKIKKDDTKIVIPIELEEETKNLGFDDILTVKPEFDYKIDDLYFSTTYSYNTDKNFHKKEYNWIGYILNFDGKMIYVAGDTDNIPEIRKIKCDIAFVPIGGTYTMNYKEAVELIKEMKPGLAIPIHYQTIVGTKEDAYNFKELLKNIVDVKILM